jgi:Fe-S-cluster containining protein
MLLRVLHESIASRVESIERSHGQWPCRKGCDACCTRLAAIPELTAAEWDLLRPVAEALPDHVQARVEAMWRVCPFLENGVCLVYEVRPVACRTYGFYVDRDGGQYCGMVEALQAHVIWGNGAAVEADMDAFGERRDLVTWWRGRHTETRPSDLGCG